MIALVGAIMVAWGAMINSAAEARSQEAKVIGCRPDSAHTLSFARRALTSVGIPRATAHLPNE